MCKETINFSNKNKKMLEYGMYYALFINALCITAFSLKYMLTLLAMWSQYWQLRQSYVPGGAWQRSPASSL